MSSRAELLAQGWQYDPALRWYSRTDPASETYAMQFLKPGEEGYPEAPKYAPGTAMFGPDNRIFDANTNAYIGRLGDPGVTSWQHIDPSGAYTNFVDHTGQAIPNVNAEIASRINRTATQAATKGWDFLHDTAIPVGTTLASIFGAPALAAATGLPNLAASAIVGAGNAAVSGGDPLMGAVTSLASSGLGEGLKALPTGSLQVAGINPTGVGEASPYVPGPLAGVSEANPLPGGTFGETFPTITEGGSIGGGDYGGAGTGGYDLPAPNVVTPSTNTSSDFLRAAGIAAAGAAAGAGVSNLLSGARTPGGDMASTAATNVTPTEARLQDELASLIRTQGSAVTRQQALQDVLTPAVLDQAGFSVTRDAAGNITGVTKNAPTPEQAQFAEQQRQILDLTIGELNRQRTAAEANAPVEAALRERELAALQGRLPVNPALLQDLSIQERELRNSLRHQLGPDYETSSPGIEALGFFNRNKESVLEAARRGDLTLSQQLMQNLAAQRTTNVQTGLPFEQFGQSEMQRMFANLISGGQAGLPGLQTTNSFINTFPGTLQSLYSNRALQAQVGLGQQQLEAAIRQGNLQGLGQFAGLGMFAPIFGVGKPTLAGRMFSSLFPGSA